MAAPEQVDIDDFRYWTEHLHGCDICKEAIQGRFKGETPKQIVEKCCDAGKPFYKLFVKEINDLWDRGHDTSDRKILDLETKVDSLEVKVEKLECVTGVAESK